MAKSYFQQVGEVITYKSLLTLSQTPLHLQHLISTVANWTNLIASLFKKKQMHAFI